MARYTAAGAAALPSGMGGSGLAWSRGRAIVVGGTGSYPNNDTAVAVLHAGLSERLYYQQDANHNVTSVADETGVVAERFAYTPYGQRTVLTAGWAATTDALDVAEGFHGQRADAAAGGIVDSRNRWYDPATGTWLSADPLGYPDGVSRYQALVGAPVGNADPSGLAIIDVLHDTKPGSVPGILTNGFDASLGEGGLGLTWFRGPGANLGGPPNSPWMLARSATLQIVMDDIATPEVKGELLAAAEQFADSQCSRRLNEWWIHKWRHVLENGGEELANGFKVVDGAGYHYAVTEKGLAVAKPTVQNVPSALEAATASAGESAAAGATEGTAATAAKGAWLRSFAGSAGRFAWESVKTGIYIELIAPTSIGLDRGELDPRVPGGLLGFACGFQSERDWYEEFVRDVEESRGRMSREVTYYDTAWADEMSRGAQAALQRELSGLPQILPQRPRSRD